MSKSEIDNKFVSNDGVAAADTKYRGIHLGVKAPTGETFELQFHTPKNLELKRQGHAQYDITRDESGKYSDDEKAKAQAESDRLYKQMEIPEGIERLKSFKK